MSEANNRPTPDVLDEAARALRDVPTPPGPLPELTVATLAAVQQRLTGTVPASEPARRQRRRKIMRYIGYGTATAAAVALATAAATFWFTGNQAVALDKVLDNVQKAESVTFVEKQKLGDQGELELHYSVRGPRVRIEFANGTALVVDTKQRTGLMLFPKEKGYLHIDKDKLHGPAGGKLPIDDLLALRDRKPTSVEKEKLDGKEVQKLTIKGEPKADPPGDWVLWIDPKTELPVKMTYSGTTSAGGKEVSVMKVYEKFDWNVKLDDKLFDMTVPEGYTDGLPGQVPTAEVLFVRAMERIGKATSMRAVITLDPGEGPKIQMKLYQQPPHMRGEVAEPGLVVILDSKEKKGLLLFTQSKIAQRLDLDKNAQAAKIATEVGGAMNVVGRLKGEKVAALPSETLDGRKLKVYELKGVKTKELPGGTDIKVWVDPKALLPVRAQLRSKQGDKMVTITIDILGWNEELDEKIFELNVPAGYKVMEPVEKK